MKRQKEQAKEDKTFEKFVVVCYIFGFICLLSLGYVYAFGIPNFSNFDEQRSFCYEQGGFPMEPSRQTYNQMICTFHLNNTYVEYVASRINEKGLKEMFGEEWREITGVKEDYCFSCWDSRSCANPHNDILREKGVHC